MTPSKILPANEAVLRRRFPDALMKIMESGNEMPVNFTYDDSGNTPTLLMVRGEFTFCPYGEKNPQRLIERWASNLKLVPESLTRFQAWVTVPTQNICWKTQARAST